MSEIPGKIANYDSFVIVMMNDEESLRELRLPSEFDPVLDKDNFAKVCFIFSMVQ